MLLLKGKKKKYREEGHAVEFGAKNLNFLKNIKVVMLIYGLLFAF
jgi:hypothetical protein